MLRPCFKFYGTCSHTASPVAVLLCYAAFTLNILRLRKVASQLTTAVGFVMLQVTAAGWLAFYRLSWRGSPPHSHAAGETQHAHEDAVAIIRRTRCWACLKRQAIDPLTAGSEQETIEVGTLVLQFYFPCDESKLLAHLQSHLGSETKAKLVPLNPRFWTLRSASRGAKSSRGRWFSSSLRGLLLTSGRSRPPTCRRAR